MAIDPSRPELGPLEPDTPERARVERFADALTPAAPTAAPAPCRLFKKPAPRRVIPRPPRGERLRLSSATAVVPPPRTPGERAERWAASKMRREIDEEIERRKQRGEEMDPELVAGLYAEIASIAAEVGRRTQAQHDREQAERRDSAVAAGFRSALDRRGRGRPGARPRASAARPARANRSSRSSGDDPEGPESDGALDTRPPQLVPTPRRPSPLKTPPPRRFAVIPDPYVAGAGWLASCRFCGAAEATSTVLDVAPVRVLPGRVICNSCGTQGDRLDFGAVTA